MAAPVSLPAIGVLDVDGLHLSDGSLAPVTGTIQHVGDLYNGARRHGLTQLWLTDAWVRAAGLPDELAVAGQFRELRHAFVSDGLADLHAFPTALTPWLDLRKKGEAGSGVSLVFPLYDEHVVWGLDTDGATLLTALLAYARALGTPYYRSPGRTGVDLLQDLGKRGADAKREYPDDAVWRARINARKSLGLPSHHQTDWDTMRAQRGPDPLPLHAAEAVDHPYLLVDTLAPVEDLCDRVIAWLAQQ